MCGRARDPDRMVESLYPLPSERRLAVPRGCKKKDRSCIAIVEELRQPGPVDKPASMTLDLSSSWFQLRTCDRFDTGKITLRRRRREWKGLDARDGGVVAGVASPSAPVVSSRRRQARCQRVFSRQQSEGDRDLPASRHAELLAKHVAVGLCRSRRDAEDQTYLVVRQTLCDQLDHLSLPCGDTGWISECLHGDKGTNPKPCAPSVERRISDRVP